MFSRPFRETQVLKAVPSLFPFGLPLSKQINELPINT